MDGGRITAYLLALCTFACGGRGLRVPPDACPPGSGVDEDGDGEDAHPCGGDCDDSQASISPGAPDPLGDGRDTNCDGVDGSDRDRDGFQSSASGGDDCDDARATVHPGANDNQGWVVEDLDFHLKEPSLAVDEAGVAHIAGSSGVGCAPEVEVENCPAGNGTAVNHLSNRDGVWTEEIVEEGRIYPTVGIAVAPGGEALISYPLTPAGVAGHQEVHIARCSEVSCEVEIVAEWDGRGGGRDGTDVAVDSRGQLVVGHQGPLSQAMVSTDRNGEWAAEFESDRDTYSLEVAADASGVYMAFIGGRLEGEPDVGIVLASRQSQGWHDEVVAVSSNANGDVAVAIEDGYFGMRVSMAADSSGAMHLVWQVAGVAHHASNASGEWVIEDVAEGYRFASVAVDASDTLHIAFGGVSGLEYGTYQPVDGIDQNCDGVDGVDADGDGRASRETGGDDPDDADPVR